MCFTPIRPGDLALVSRDEKGTVRKVLCTSEECREAFDDFIWQCIADKRNFKDD